MCKALWLKGGRGSSQAFGVGCFISSLLAQSGGVRTLLWAQGGQGWSPPVPQAVLCPIPRWEHPGGSTQAAPRGCQEVSGVFGLTQPPPEGKAALLPPALTSQEEFSQMLKPELSWALPGGSAPWDALGWAPSPTALPWAEAAEQPGLAWCQPALPSLALGRLGWISQRELSELSLDVLITDVRDSKQITVIVGNWCS